MMYISMQIITVACTVYPSGSTQGTTKKKTDPKLNQNVENLYFNYAVGLESM